ncbi:MAG: class I SAM-dependent methyltransferase [Tepidanaerobacteraceae bacterium]|jgi:ubiquinone/menaquinone biosynthesis C-methylase UbiE
MRVFDDEANSYDIWYENKIGAFADIVQTQLAFSLFKPKKGMHVLDVGCGTGNFSLKLARMGLKVTGIDISDNMLKVAENKARAEGLIIDFINMDAHDMKFEDNSFDAVISMAVIEFICEPEKTLKEMFRVVKKGGEILIGTINRDSKWGELYLSKEFRENSVFKYASLKTMDELVTLYPEKPKATDQCLFIPPDMPEDKICIDIEKQLSATERGGFICALWVK